MTEMYSEPIGPEPLPPPLTIEELDVQIIDALNFLDDWYGRFGTLKHLSLRRAAELCARSVSLVHRIAYAPIRMTNEETAHTEGINIYLPNAYFSEAYYESIRMPKELLPQLSMLLFNGSAAHEALHIRESECDMLVAAEKAQTAMVDDVNLEQLARENMFFVFCMQLVEDVFIEAYGQFYFPKHWIFIASKNAIFFHSDLFAQQMQKIEEKKDILGVLYFRKNTFLDDREEWSPYMNYVEILDEAKDIEMTKVSRTLLAYKLYKEFLEDEENQGDCNMPGIGEDQSQTIYIDSAMAQAISMEQQLSIGTGDKDSPIHVVITSDEMNNEIEKEELKIKSKDSDEMGEKRQVVYQDVLQIKPEYESFLSSVNPPKQWTAFSKYYRFFMEEKHVPGRLKNVGSKLISSRIHRIAIDDRILADRDRNSMKKGVPENLFLVDLSGSMGQRVDAPSYGDDVTLAGMTVIASYGILLSLASARMPVAVYGHTSIRGRGEEKPLVIGIGAFNMPLGQTRRLSNQIAKNRFLHAGRVDITENFDGYAIEYVSKLFTSKPGSKVISVLSDGEPSAPEYRGAEARKHTKGVIDGLRKSGIYVMCYSLVASVVSANDQIYGKDNNVRAYGNGFDRAVQEAILRVSKNFK